MAAKAITVIALAVGAGGVAVAATTSSFGHGPFGASPGARSEPVATDSRRTLVVDRTSDRPAEPSPPAIGPHGLAGFEVRPGSCQDGAGDRCAAPTATVPPSPPSGQPAVPVANGPADSRSSTEHSATRRPPAAPAEPARKKNQHGSAGKTTPKKQPPGQAAKKADQIDDNPPARTTDED